MGVTLLNSYRFAPSSLGFSDNFARADSASLGVATSGQTWQQTAPSHEIVSGKARRSTAGGQAVIDSLLADGQITCDIDFIGPNPSLVVRLTDNSNYITAHLYAGHAHIGKMVAGVFTDLADGGVASCPTSGVHSVQVTFAGSALAVLIDGVTKVTASESFNASATKHGLGNEIDTLDETSTFDNVVCS